ncbi:MAG: Aspartate-tRNA ligase [Candidatus Saccharibacteria bacterium GW2011_GWA2_46_10]|nr:MAG: Aspartate-tRNA ligase [Candidatus Saccharibacteria bacterium GW2011_GWA2_46_10]
MLRSHTCGELNLKHAKKEVTLCGWVHRRRDHGGLIFIDLRDRYGFTQIVFDPSNKEAFTAAEKVRPEWVIKTEGTVRKRIEGALREDNPTGAIEVLAKSITVFSQAETPPFEIDRPPLSASADRLRPASQEKEVSEDVRLKYRFLDLRRPKMQEMMQKRDKFIMHIRDYMHKRGFTEVQTPILANSSPEGARDYLVPSRLFKGMFYALPQAPQQFKQLLMVAGLDRYFQIAPCFRDEDPRADRHPGEFYQLDLEMSFVTQEDIFETVEPLMKELTKEFSDKKLVFDKFPRLTWKESMTKYGTDKPDLRFDLEIKDVSEFCKGCGFKVFSDAVEKGSVVHALNVRSAGFSRKDIDDLTETAKIFGARGLAWIKVSADSFEGVPVEKLGKDLTKKIADFLDAKNGDVIFFGADKWLETCKFMGAVRNAIGGKKGLKDSSKAAWGWIVDFPMYEWNENEKKIDFSHNPFSMPQGGMDTLISKDPLDILGYQYDLFCNGFEISSGAIRNYSPEIMYKAFEIAGYSKKEVDEKFGGMIRAFKFGAPPHGGFAPGIDRLMMVLWECPSIRDIYAFPKNGRAQDAMMGAPAPVTEKQLRELGIKVVD